VRLDTPLDDLLASRSHVRLLRALHRLFPGLELSARDLARRAGVSHPTASAVLRALVDQGLVRVRKARRGDYFELNRDHVLFQDLQRLFEREEGLLPLLAAFLGQRLGSSRLPIVDAFLFGSAVWGEVTPTSDLDLALVCAPEVVPQVEDEAFGPLADSVRRQFGGRLSPLVGSPSLEALRDLHRDGHQLWERIASEGLRVFPANPTTGADAQG
jgi:DNA-binding transcriptional ArsR family regulator